MGTISCLIWLRTLLWVSITPLGFPVDPLVYIIIATSSPFATVSGKQLKNFVQWNGLKDVFMVFEICLQVWG